VLVPVLAMVVGWYMGSAPEGGEVEVASTEGFGREREESGKKPVSLKSETLPASLPEQACRPWEGLRVALCKVDGVVVVVVVVVVAVVVVVWAP
jgi:hypothetical protein